MTMDGWLGNKSKTKWTRSSSNKIVNRMGQQLLTWGESVDLLVLNGMMCLPRFGTYTFVGQQGNSHINILWATSKCTKCTQNFQIKRGVLIKFKRNLQQSPKKSVKGNYKNKCGQNCKMKTLV
eukprot:TRINITY_DN27590_c0_g1_i1.p1 TRINITY_DN27590_c0_g1~~TRINITY_DN27590_c0_g1_i1.p1  ORF type:complete len:123 (+),score=15.31 TRINITY_DN27590_c0_g1_i1:170-538(+)